MKMDGVNCTLNNSLPIFQNTEKRPFEYRKLHFFLPYQTFELFYMVSINFNMHYKAYIRALYGVYTTSDTDKHIVSEIKFDVITHCFKHIYIYITCFFSIVHVGNQYVVGVSFAPSPLPHPPTLQKSIKRCYMQLFGMGLLPDTENCGCAYAGNAGSFSPPPEAKDPDMHHGTCVTHVPWCMPGSLTSGFLWSRRRGKTFPAFPAHAQPAMLRIW